MLTSYIETLNANIDIMQIDELSIVPVEKFISQQLLGKKEGNSLNIKDYYQKGK